MKVKMISDFSDVDGYPKTGDILEVREEIFNGSFLECYSCEWNGKRLDIYPYECEEVSDNA
ncbi:hypothetical protein K5Y72_003087 [Escherichia coli]|uniref:Uncharacterized protein n=1 Tax=Escherichia phage Av-05 TaxID=1527519 RepID=A0A076G6T8_9CAUD|nr:hypothetical protein [Escherichia coli]YP_009111231.1 exonuclease [Escherichia phage Av-05]AII27700.1 hypothetical protein Av05_00157 [Escherichia phage Av-05]EHP9877515.1 hypothetical protein [Escherichia coli]EIM2934269.1 hypothetical protein [Escherichia coli]MCD4173121.1 hypothetical protein [Escherichia coli]